MSQALRIELKNLLSPFLQQLCGRISVGIDDESGAIPMFLLYIQFKVTPRGAHLPMKLEIPVTIGTVPLGGVVIMQEQGGGGDGEIARASPHL